jgi:phosphoenolpyruvate-protein kinase (PTS system EI component)
MWHFEIIMNSDVQALQTLNLITSVGTNDLLQVMLMIDKMQHLKPQRHRQNYIKM